MTAEPCKMSEIMKEMSEILLRHPTQVPSSEAAHVALFFANVAWNESVGLADSREGYGNVWETIASENPELWNEFTDSSGGNWTVDSVQTLENRGFSSESSPVNPAGVSNAKVRTLFPVPRRVRPIPRAGTPQ